MSMTDPIADMLTRIRNACMARLSRVDLPASQMKRSIAEILKEEGYIRRYKILKEGPQGTLRIYLKYDEENRPVIEGLKRVSKPGRRIYVKAKDIPRVMGGYGIGIISTSQGLLTDREARKKRIGGEYLCMVW